MTDEELKGLFDSLRQNNAVVHEENAAAHAETRRHLDVTVERLEKENAAAHAETHRRLNVTNVTVERLEKENATAHAETRRHFDVTVERLEKRFAILAESVTRSTRRSSAESLP